MEGIVHEREGKATPNNFFFWGSGGRKSERLIRRSFSFAESSRDQVLSYRFPGENVKRFSTDETGFAGRDRCLSL